jgi:hypothetical protein
VIGIGVVEPFRGHRCIAHIRNVSVETINKTVGNSFRRSAKWRNKCILHYNNFLEDLLMILLVKIVEEIITMDVIVPGCHYEGDLLYVSCMRKTCVRNRIIGCKEGNKQS